MENTSAAEPPAAPTETPGDPAITRKTASSQETPAKTPASGLAITATVVIVLGIAGLVVVAFLKTR